MKNTFKLSAHGSTLMVAHRGLSGIERENTCSAFVAAANRSYFGIETDVRPTSDGYYVLSHDPDTDRNSGEHFTVSESEFETLRKLRYKDRDGSYDRGDLMIPTLAEYIKICKTYGKVCVLELKDEFSLEQCGDVIGIIKDFGYLDNVIFISFWFENLLCVRKVYPEAVCQFLTGDDPMKLINRLAENSIGIDVYFGCLTEDSVKALKERGITVNCWTVDSPEDAQRLVSWGVDMITTNIVE